MHVSLNLNLFKFKDPEYIQWSEKTMCALLDTLVEANIQYLKRNKVPPLYEAGVRYRREPRGQENWNTIPFILTKGFGDCEDLACWRAAELNTWGEKAGVFMRVQVNPAGFRLYHILVKRGNGKIEDPSKLLGMKGSA